MNDKSGGRRLDSDTILAAAARLLEDDGRLTMRALATRLGADPMAVYHYFPNKDALYQALALHSFARLDGLAGRMELLDDWRDRLTLLAEQYLAAARAAPALTRLLAGGAQAAGPVTERFAALFALATANLPLQARDGEAAMHLLVDCIHGYAMAGGADAAGLRNELRVLAAGMAALAMPVEGALRRRSVR